MKSVFRVYKEGHYQTLGSGSLLVPWDGFFSAPLGGANGRNAKLLFRGNRLWVEDEYGRPAWCHYMVKKLSPKEQSQRRFVL